jgi:preprotein translocase subunit YajC
MPLDIDPPLAVLLFTRFPGGPPGAGASLNAFDLVPVLLIFAVMYFLVIRPQVAEKQSHEKLLGSLARGDRVVTASGIHGTIGNVDADTVVLEVGERVRLVVDKTSIARRVEEKKDGDKKTEDASATKSG